MLINLLETLKVRAIVTEIVGTFSLIAYGGFSVFSADNGKSGVLTAAFGHGAVLAVYILIGAEYSGA